VQFGETAANHDIKCKMHVWVIILKEKKKKKNIFRTNEVGKLVACLPLHCLQ